MCNNEHAMGIDKAVFPGTQGGPLEHIIAGKAVALGEALQDSFKDYSMYLSILLSCLLYVTSSFSLMHESAVMQSSVSADILMILFIFLCHEDVCMSFYVFSRL